MIEWLFMRSLKSHSANDISAHKRVISPLKKPEKHSVEKKHTLPK